MRKLLLLVVTLLINAEIEAQVLKFADLNTRQFARLDKNRTVVIIPGGILEEHGPYLPSGTDGIFNAKLANDLARAVGARPGWTALLMPQIPLGAGAANEMGEKYSFPGSCTISPETLRLIFMDLGDQLGKQGFRWVVVIHGHGDPAHNRMLDQAGDYFHDSYGGEMINLFGYLWAMDLKDFRSAEEQRKDGLPEHATMNETSWILALKPEAVAPDYKTAVPHSGQSINELEEIASRADWPGYFGAPSLASPALGWKMYDQWLKRGTELVVGILNGEDYRKLPRYGVIYADDPADAAAQSHNRELQLQHEAWLKKAVSGYR